MDSVDVDNGCMWFSPGAHKKELWPHRPVKPGVHVLMCEATEVIITHIRREKTCVADSVLLGCFLSNFMTQKFIIDIVMSWSK